MIRGDQANMFYISGAPSKDPGIDGMGLNHHPGGHSDLCDWAEQLANVGPGNPQLAVSVTRIWSQGGQKEQI